MKSYLLPELLFFNLVFVWQTNIAQLFLKWEFMKVINNIYSSKRLFWRVKPNIYEYIYVCMKFMVVRLMNCFFLQ